MLCNKCIPNSTHLRRTRQIIRYRATATLRRLQIKQYTASNEGGGDTKPTGTSQNFDKVCSGAPFQRYAREVINKDSAHVRMNVLWNSLIASCIPTKVLTNARVAGMWLFIVTPTGMIGIQRGSNARLQISFNAIDVYTDTIIMLRWTQMTFEKQNQYLTVIW